MDEALPVVGEPHAAAFEDFRDLLARDPLREPDEVLDACMTVHLRLADPPLFVLVGCDFRDLERVVPRDAAASKRLFQEGQTGYAPREAHEVASGLRAA